MATSKKLEIIYHNGQPDGIRSIRRHLSTMTTYVIPRPLLSEAKKITADGYTAESFQALADAIAAGESPFFLVGFLCGPDSFRCEEPPCDTTSRRSLGGLSSSNKD